jgi:hypothetical protein
VLTRDLADTSLASYRQDPADSADSLSDLAREIASQSTLPLPSTFQERTEQFCRLLEDAIAAKNPEAVSSRVTAEERQLIVYETLMAVYGDTRHKEDVRLIAISVLATMGRVPGSYQEIGDKFATTRACPHLHSRRFEKRTGIRPRRAKDDDARATSKANATGRRRGDSPKAHRGSNVFACFPGLASLA